MHKGFILIILACFFYCSTVSAIIITPSGPKSELYVTLWQNAGIAVVQGNTIVRSWANSGNLEIAISVTDKVRTLGHYSSGTGAEYTLDGTFTGTTFGTTTSYFHDGASDGQYSYAILWNTGNLYRYNTNWTNPQYMFNVGAQSVGITYDPTNDSFWVSNWGDGSVKNFSRSGALLSSFSTGYGYLSGLAMDYADGTLWMSPSAGSTLVQYSRTGTQLSSVTYNFAGGVYGAEFAFAVPEPSTIALLMLAIGLLGLWKKKN